MSTMIACCGLDCAGCPAYIATRQDDQAGRERVASLWSTKEFPLKPEDVICEGCRSTSGRLMSFCRACKTRACCLARGHENCAHCEEYVCELLERHFSQSQALEMRSTLDGIRKRLRG